MSAALVALVVYLGAVGLGYVGKLPVMAMFLLTVGVMIAIVQFFVIANIRKSRWITAIGMTAAEVSILAVLTYLADDWLHIPHDMSFRSVWFWLCILAIGLLSALVALPISYSKGGSKVD